MMTVSDLIVIESSYNSLVKEIINEYEWGGNKEHKCLEWISGFVEKVYTTCNGFATQ